MERAMKLDVIRIGNSRGVRLPKAVLEQVGVGEAVSLTVEDDRIVLTPAKKSGKSRAGWAERFAATDAADDARWPSTTSSFDDEEWSW
jgi:antitoxin MazE